jgi:hypothetical protein
MQFWFDVGRHEIHRVVFSFDKMWGKTLITVDGFSVVEHTEWFSLSTVKTFEFVVGQQEQHHVAIRKTRTVFMAFARPMVYEVFVDGWPFRTFEG